MHIKFLSFIKKLWHMTSLMSQRLFEHMAHLISHLAAKAAAKGQNTSCQYWIKNKTLLCDIAGVSQHDITIISLLNRFIEYTPLYLFLLQWYFCPLGFHCRSNLIFCSCCFRGKVRNCAAIHQPGQGWNCLWERSRCGGDTEESGGLVVHQVSLCSLAAVIKLLD